MMAFSESPIENAAATGPWRCSRCRYDARGLAFGAPCTECGRPLREDSLRPVWLEPGSLAKVRAAARLAATASFVLAMLPLLAAGFGLVLPGTPGQWTVVAIVSVAVATTLAAQTFAALRLAAHALPKPERNRFIALVLIRVPLLVLLLLGTQVLLVTKALTLEFPGGDYAALSRGFTSWLAWILPQAAIAIPAIAAEVLLARAARRIARGVSDDRPAWKDLNSLFGVTVWLFALAGLISMVPIGGWVLGPLLLLVGDSVLFGAVARSAGLHMSDPGNRSGSPS
jgi:hypothetical protein